MKAFKDQTKYSSKEFQVKNETKFILKYILFQSVLADDPLVHFIVETILKANSKWKIQERVNHSMYWEIKSS